MTAQTIRWGILGTGAMAAAFARALQGLPGASLVAVGSRTEASARAFAARAGVARAHGSYAGLLADPAVDVVYVATVNTTHHALCLESLAAGKPVLCEKPFALNAAQGREIADRARQAGLFCMEAMWTRFLPAVARFRELVRSGDVGEARLLTASLGFPYVADPTGRQFDPSLGGGALLDLGVYPISLAHFLFGPPTQIGGRATLTATGVDAVDAITLVHGGGQISTLAAGLTVAMPNDAVVTATGGQVQLHGPLYRPDRITVRRTSPIAPAGGGGGGGGRLAALRERPAVRALAAQVKSGLARLKGETRPIHAPYLGNGYPHQALEVIRCLRDGLCESPIMPLDESVAILATTDELRRQWGIRFPGELETGPA